MPIDRRTGIPATIVPLPSQSRSSPTIRADPRTLADAMGLIPSWALDASGAARMINARSETADTKPAFRDALRLRRCLVPGDGFYEWQRTGKAKQPFCFELNDGELLAFAGLWARGSARGRITFGSNLRIA